MPHSTTEVILTATAAQKGQYYIGYSGTLPESGTKLIPQGTPRNSGEPSPPLALQVGFNRVGATSACSGCAKLYTVNITREPLSYTKGDPIFAGLLGQVFQVHGVAGEVYSVISDPAVQINSRFVFLTGGECPILNGRKANACWTHPGSYLGDIGIKTAAGHRLLISSGSAKHGFKKVELNGEPLEFEEQMALPSLDSGLDGALGRDGFVVRNSTHLVTVQVSNFLLEIENSDHFLNYRLRVLDWSALSDMRPHGLLGQTYRKPTKPGRQIKYIEGRVDDYQIKEGDIFGDDFAYNRFGLEQKEDERNEAKTLLE